MATDEIDISGRPDSPDRLVIFDTTLRDGEQAPGCSMTLSEKLRVARALSELNVDVIEAGFPISSPGDFRAVQRISREVRNCTICGLTRANPKDIGVAAEALEDLSYALDIEPSFLARVTGLSVAFGARGRPGACAGPVPRCYG
mgnify:CR=1 FL=1